MSVSNSVAPEITLEKLLKDIESLEAIVAEWDEHERLTVTALKRAIDDLNKEAMARLIRGLKKSPEAMAAKLLETKSYIQYYDTTN